VNILVGALGVTLGALIAGIATYVTTRAKTRTEFEYSYDRALWEARLVHYQRLFHISACLPRYWPDGEPARSEYRGFLQQFHDWYFGSSAGGMFLSAKAKGRYMDLMNALGAISGAVAGSQSGGEVNPEESIEARRPASELRHQLAEDIGAAHAPKLR
jgi:hypothetical protein